MKVNPTTISWTPTTQWTDGSAFLPEHFAGYEFAWSSPDPTDGWTPVVAVPVSFDQTTLPINVLDLPRQQEFELAMRTVAYNETVSDWAIAPGTFTFDERTPNAPLAFSVV